MRQLPRARYLLIEAQDVHRAALERFCAAHPNAEFVLAAAGDRRGTIPFDASTPHGGQATLGGLPADAVVIAAPMTTIDYELRQRGLPGPYLIKLDTHGFELPILAGAADALARTEALVIECYNFKLSPECLTFDALCAHMRALGFRPIDLFDPLHRPRDGALWQFDLVFARADRPEFASNEYA
jgi:FkbM family methyltransferase